MTELNQRKGTLFASPFELDADLPASELEVVCSVWAELHHTWTRFDDQSPLQKMNRSSGEWLEVEPLLLWAARSCVAATEATDGLFNPLVDLSALGYTNTWPNTTEPGRANPLEPNQYLEVRDGKVKLPKGRALDLGGVAKGMAADWAVSYLKESGATIACANIGGDVAVLGERQVVVEDANGVVWWNWKVTGGGVCTSSTKSRAWSGVHHIVNPRTGLSVDSIFHTVSSHAGSAVAAEIANKAALVSGSLEHAHNVTGAVVVAGRDGDVRIEQTSTARLFGSPAIRLKAVTQC